MPMATLRSFAGVEEGIVGRVVSVSLDAADARRLQEMGLTPGAVFKVIKVAPFGDPVEICVRGCRLCLRRKEAKGIMFETED